jgi:acetate kinase
MSDAVVVLNAGSSSLKAAVFEVCGEDPRAVVRCRIDGLPQSPRLRVEDERGTTRLDRRWPQGEHVSRDQALEIVLGALDADLAGHRLVAFGHRVVHGGDRAEPMRVDADGLAALQALVPLAPLHQSHNLAPIVRLRATHPDVPQVACFDTAFHRTNPDVAQRFALPAALFDEGVKRYGFHGLSFEYVAWRLADLDATAAAGRTIALHLGHGASLCALRGGRSVATSMGFTPLDGVPMGTRPGALDPGVVLHLLDRGLDARAIERLLYHQSGLLGVSGRSADMRELLADASPEAARAVDLFIYRVGREIGSLAAALGGLDALVFTAGIGENSPQIRARVATVAAWLGATLDEPANRAGRTRLDAAGSRVSIWVIPTDEERMIARHTWRRIGGAP